MAYSDDDLEGRVIASDGYEGRSRGPITAFEVRDGDVLRAYVWFADDPAEAAAGSIGVLSGGSDGGNAAVAWYAALREAKAAGLTAEDAVLGLRGRDHVDPRFGRVGSVAGHWPDDRALRTAANPDPPGPPQGREAPAVFRAAVDAVLMGRARSTPEVEASIRALDSALAGRPTPDPVVVWFPSELERFGGVEPIEGMHVDEPTYLTARFDTADTDLGDAALVAKVRIPAGVPALWVAHAGGDPEAPSTLLLGRGLRWTVLRVVRAPERTVVFGRADAPSDG